MAVNGNLLIGSLASITTALAAVVFAVGVWLLIVLVHRKSKELLFHLDKSGRSEGMNEQQFREWKTIEICQQYFLNYSVEGACRRLWSASRGGADYSDLSLDKADAACVLAYLNSIAAGIENGLYDADCVKRLVGGVVQHYVRNLLISGFVPRESYPALLQIYHRWFTLNLAEKLCEASRRAGDSH